MTQFLHTEADLQAGLAQLILADPRLKPVAEKAGAFALRRREAGFPGLCAIVCGQQLSTASAAAIRARLFAAFDPFHHDTVLQGAHRQAQAARAVGRQDQVDPRDRQGGGAGAHRSGPRRRHGCRRRPRRAHRAARHRTMDRRYLSLVLPRPCRCVSRRRPGGAGIRAHCLRLAQAARRQGADQVGRGLAALARCGGASVVGLLSRGEAARGRVARAGREIKEACEKENGQEEGNEEIAKKTSAKKTSAKKGKA